MTAGARKFSSTGASTVVASADDVIASRAGDVTTSLFLEAAGAQLATISAANDSDDASLREIVERIMSIVPLIDG